MLCSPRTYSYGPVTTISVMANSHGWRVRLLINVCALTTESHHLATGKIAGAHVQDLLTETVAKAEGTLVPEVWMDQPKTPNVVYTSTSIPRSSPQRSIV